MAKKRLTEISEEYGISFEESQKIVFDNLEEEMVTGKGKNLWINEDGQRVLDDLISMPILYRGPVLSQAPNPMYVMAYIKELTKKVPVKIPRRMIGKITKGKLIYIEADNSVEPSKYNWVKTPQRS
tara:strand:+ start:3747 stop:4124 length:378 start_codon:yes stop_codon:yes gene_type:complete